MVLEFRNATLDDIPELSSLYAESFVDNEAYCHIFQYAKTNLELHTKSLTWFFAKRLYLHIAYDMGPFHIAYETENPQRLLGAGGCKINSCDPGLFGMIYAGILQWPFLWGFASLSRVMELNQSLHASISQANKSIYGELSMVAVHSSARGSGVGTAMVKHLLEQPSLKGKVLSLSTQKEINLSFYSKNGFQLLCKDEVHGFSTWTMIRVPNDGELSQN